MKKTLKIALIAILFVGLLLSGCSSSPDNPGPATATVGEIAPDFKLQNLEGKAVSLRSFGDKPVLINFWATWCSACVYEMPFLEQIHEEWSEKGLVMLAINVGESPAKIQSLLKRYNFSIPVLLDTTETVARKYGVTGWPTTFLIDRDGVVQDRVIGAFPNKAEIEKRLSKIIP